jgi:predicted RNA binding protein YcfA (HicA-like mRNA interferase family)
MGIKELPLDTGERITRVFERRGFQRRRTGNHIILTHPNKPSLCISIPNHREIDRRLLHAEIRKTGLTDHQFRKTYDEL